MKSNSSNKWGPLPSLLEKKFAEIARQRKYLQSLILMKSTLIDLINYQSYSFIQAVKVYFLFTFVISLTSL